ncbi:tetratricopeptide repeat protein [Tumebacillus lipolyticus]|uniref:Tetratricopeptide repeat protein n=1 Tax=Tumebacillus lipolyticus TaxID=1280370 RepID=A0ABW4ZXA4_9BACL
MRLGDRIKELRIAKGLTQGDLGKGIVTPSMISQIESNKANPSYNVLKEIARRLDTQLEHFLADVEIQMEHQSILKVARAYMSSGSYTQAAKLLIPLLDTPHVTIEQAAALRLKLSECYLQVDQYEKVEDLCDQTLELYRRHGNTLGMIQTLHQLGQMEYRRRKYHIAIYHWRKAYELFEQLKVPDPFTQSTLLLDLGNVFLQYGEPPESLKYYEQAQQLLTNTAHFDQIAESYLGLAKNFLKIGECEKAQEYAEYSTSISKAFKLIKGSIDVKKQLAAFKLHEEKHDDALFLLTNCAKDYERYSFQNEALATQGEIARLHLQKQKFEECIKLCEDCLAKLSRDALEAAPLLRTKGIALAANGQLEESVEMILQSIALYEKFEDWSEVADSYSILADLHQKQENYTQAIQSLQLMKQYIEHNLKSRGIIL